MIILEALNKNNWKTCANLKVKAEQKDSIPDNLISIAELNFYPNTEAVAIVKQNQKTKENTIVGFATFGTPECAEKEKMSKIFRLMIDEKYQGKGYGRQALIQIVEKLFIENKSKQIQVCYHPNKEKLKQFYTSLGFKNQEILQCELRKEGKMLAVLELNVFMENNY